MSETMKNEQEHVQDSAASSSVPVWQEEDMRDVLRAVVDPELHMNIVDLGLVYRVEQKGPRVEVDMTLTSPGCPFGPYILHQVRENVLTLKGIEDVGIEVVWDPLWSPELMTDEARLELGFDI
jgi:metal-sulfur cluster biosynthetic enzyme